MRSQMEHVRDQGVLNDHFIHSPVSVVCVKSLFSVDLVIKSLIKSTLKGNKTKVSEGGEYFNL